MMTTDMTILLVLLLATAALSFTLSPVSPRGTAWTSSALSAEPDTLSQPDSYVRCSNCQTSYALAESDLGNGKGRRLECSICGHSWFQSKDRIMQLKDGFEMVSLPDSDLERIETNIKEGKSPRFTGESKLYVGNIAFECHEEDLITVFSRVGVVGEVSLVRDDSGKNRGFGFITMRTKDEGKKAIDELDGTSIRGRSITVRESNN